MEIREGTLVPRRRRLVGGATATLGAVAVLSMVMLAFASSAAAAIGLGTADSFAVLGGSTVTNTGSTTVVGDLGVSPGTAVTGFPPGLVGPPGTIHAADAVALQAQTDVTTAYNNAAGQAFTTDLTSQDLGGLTLTPGVYRFSTSAQLTGTLTLNGQGNPDAEFLFQIGSTLTTASNSSVSLINGAQSCNVFWQVGSSATLGTSTSFSGTILALTSITATTGATVDGRLLARNGAVTLDTNTIAKSTCADTDEKPPICVLTASVLGPPKSIQVTVQDTGSGLGSVTVDTSTNASTVVPPFTPGTTSPVVITATKINSSQSSTVQLTVRDVAGNETVCDPVWSASKSKITERFNKRGQRVRVHRGLQQAESKISIENGSPGITYVEFVVNGKKYVVRRMRAGQTYKFSVAKAMKPGSNNTIVIRLRGRMGGNALVVVSD